MLVNNLGLQTDSKISDFICDPIRKIIKIIRSVSVSKEIRILIRIRKILTDMDIWLLPIRNRPFSYYPSISDIIRRYLIRFYPNTYPKKISLCVFNYIFLHTLQI
jgi:hypothetical protein